jgi:hypothetical protein
MTLADRMMHRPLSQIYAHHRPLDHGHVETSPGYQLPNIAARDAEAEQGLVTYAPILSPRPSHALSLLHPLITPLNLFMDQFHIPRAASSLVHILSSFPSPSEHSLISGVPTQSVDGTDASTGIKGPKRKRLSKVTRYSIFKSSCLQPSRFI